MTLWFHQYRGNLCRLNKSNIFQDTIFCGNDTFNSICYYIVPFKYINFDILDELGNEINSYKFVE